MPPEDRLTISVAMTTYQAGAFLLPQLASIAAQTLLPDELVVYDDGSTDETWNVLTDFATSAPFTCQLSRQESNVGLHHNIQSTLAACTADVVVLADQDDLWEPEKLASVAHAFDDRDVTLWFSNARLIDHAGRPLDRTSWDAVGLSVTEARDLDSDGGLRRLLHGMTVTGAAMAVRRDILDVALPLPNELQGEDHLFLHDGWLAALAAIHGRVVAEPRALTRYRQHAGQVTAMSMASAAQGLRGAGTSWRRSTDEAGARKRELFLERARVSLVAQRIRDTSSGVVPLPGKLAYLHDLERFLNVRTLARSAEHRRLRVAQQLVRGAYGRHARGLRTALKDLR